MGGVGGYTAVKIGQLLKIGGMLTRLTSCLDKFVTVDNPQSTVHKGYTKHDCAVYTIECTVQPMCTIQLSCLLV